MRARVLGLVGLLFLLVSGAHLSFAQAGGPAAGRRGGDGMRTLLLVLAAVLALVGVIHGTPASAQTATTDPTRVVAAQAALLQAFEIARSMPASEQKRPQFLARIAQAYARTGSSPTATAMVAEALSVARALDSRRPYEKVLSLAVIASAQAVLGDAAAARATLAEAQVLLPESAGLLAFPYLRAHQWRAIASAHRGMGDAAAAGASMRQLLEATRQMYLNERYPYIVDAIVFFTEVNDLTGAQAICTEYWDCGGPQDDALRRAMNGLARAMVAADERIGAAKLLADAGTSLVSVPETLALQREAAGDAGARALVAAALTQWRERPRTNYSLSVGLARLAKMQGEVGDTAGGVATVSEALVVANGIRRGPERADAMAEIVLAQRRLGDVTGAGETLLASRAATQEMLGRLRPDLARRRVRAIDMLAMHQVVDRQIALGDVAEAWSTLSEIIVAARAARSAEERAAHLALATASAVGMGRLPDARALAREAASAARGTTRQSRMLYAVVQAIPLGPGSMPYTTTAAVIAYQQAYLGDHEDAMATAGAIADPKVRATALMAIASVLLSGNVREIEGDPPEAEQLD